jgi:hypothetical protein
MHTHTSYEWQCEYIWMKKKDDSQMTINAHNACKFHSLKFIILQLKAMQKDWNYAFGGVTHITNLWYMMVHCKHKTPNSTNYEFDPPTQVHKHNITPKSYTNLNESNLVKGLFHHQSCGTIIPSSKSRLYKSLGPLTLKSSWYKDTKPNCNGKHIDVRESRGGKKPKMMWGALAMVMMI